MTTATDPMAIIRLELEDADIPVSTGSEHSVWVKLSGDTDVLITRLTDDRDADYEVAIYSYDRSGGVASEVEVGTTHGALFTRLLVQAIVDYDKELADV